MQLRFFCVRHRIELMSEPDRAGEVWISSLQRLRNGRPEPGQCPVHVCGCAMEAATIHLRANPVCSEETLEHYIDTALLLMRLLTSRDRGDLATAVLDDANDMLEQIARWGTRCDVAARASRRLNGDGQDMINRPAAGREVVPGMAASPAAAATLH